nr:uncharacterized protein LOC118879575 isoform X2 [Drosophila suzukii]
MQQNLTSASTIYVAATLHIFKCDAPVVPLQQGTVWRTNGVFKLAHVINLGRMQQLIDQVANEATIITDQHIGALVGHYLQRASDGTSRMDSAPTRRQRSIDWLGSAWKWVLGSPDKSDWNAILKEEDSLLNLPTRKDWSGQHESLGSRRDQYDIGGGGQPALSKRR